MWIDARSFRVRRAGLRSGSGQQRGAAMAATAAHTGRTSHTQRAYLWSAATASRAPVSTFPRKLMVAPGSRAGYPQWPRRTGNHCNCYHKLRRPRHVFFLSFLG